jgi:hypothetical protein
MTILLNGRTIEIHADPDMVGGQKVEIPIKKGKQLLE